MPEPSLSAANRPLVFDNPLGANALLIRRFDGTTGVSSLFDFTVELLSENGDLDLCALLGQAVTIKVRAGKDEWCYFNGIVEGFFHDGMEGEYHQFVAHVVPWIWPLTLSKNCRVFQAKSVKDIVTDVISTSGLQGGFEFRLAGEHPLREYCVQYQESDYDFISRLLEEEGICFFFAHADGEHRLVFADEPAAWRETPLKADFEVRAGEMEGVEEDFVKEFRIVRRLTSGRYAAGDYNFNKPGVDLNVAASCGEGGEVFEWPGGFQKLGFGRTLAERRAEEISSLSKVGEGSGSCRTLRPGYKFRISGHTRKDHDGEYVVCRMSCSASQSLPIAGGIGADYDVYFEAIPASCAYRPKRLTPRPRILGPQSATVVGKKGEELWTDKYASVKVQFFWDRAGKRNETSSCWVRCLQPVAGRGWGHVFLPRVGQEVLVAFRDGDPDRPVVVGGLYNDECLPPYDLPGEQQRSGIRTRSTQKGGAANYNELCFVDTKGKEMILVRAEKDLQIETENDKCVTVGNDLSASVENSASIDAKEMVISAKQKITIECAGSKIELSAKGIVINGALIKLN